MRPLRILTWHVHGGYLYYLSKIPHELILPIDHRELVRRTCGYMGKTPNFDWSASVREVPADKVKFEDLDCIVYQSAKNYTDDQFRILSETQRRLPKLYIEHDPPQMHPTNTKHVVDDPEVVVVHVTHFNQLMWDCGRSETTVIEHGVPEQPLDTYKGDFSKGIVVVNNLNRRGRRLGADIYLQAKQQVDLDLIGMNSAEMGGRGEVAHRQLTNFLARYRFFFNPIRYTSLGLAVCEAMMAGLPIVGLATTELATVIENETNGFIDTNVGTLIERMEQLAVDWELAHQWGRAAHQTAMERFHIRRFVDDWDETLRTAAGRQFWRMEYEPARSAH